MHNIVYCEILKLKRSKILYLSIIGVFATPIMLLIEAIQTHVKHPEQIFTLNDIYQNSLLYIMLLMNMMIYVAVAAYLFSREYTERTLKTILPVPVSRSQLIVGKFSALFLWIMMLTFVTWGGIFVLSALYEMIIGMEGFHVVVAVRWLFQFMISGLLMFFTVTPYAFLAEKTKGLVTPMIVSAGMVMGNAVLSNQHLGALYPWTATYFLIGGKIEESGYTVMLSIMIISILSIGGLIATFSYFIKEDLK